MMITAPVFRHEAIPPQVKVFLSVILAMICTTAFGKYQPTIDFHLWYLVFLVMKEMMAGMLIGFSVNFVFYAARFAGGLLDMEMGYQTGLLFDPSQGIPTLLGELKEMITLILFLIIGGHYQLIESMMLSFKAIPLTKFAMTESTLQLLARQAASVFILGVKISAPVLVALFCTNLALALLARVAPQTNIFILSFQVKVVVGLLVLSFSVPLLIYILKWALGLLQGETMRMILTLNPGSS